MNIPSINLVVGSNGFIGKNILGALKGECEVTGVANRTSWQRLMASDVDFSEFKSIYWCASTVNPSTASSFPDLVEKELETWNNFLVRLNSIPVARRPKVVFISSGGCTYTDSSEPFTEDSEAFGTNEYGKMKIEQESALRHFSVPFAILRAGNVYGPGQAVGRGQGVIANWIHSYREAKVINVFGSQETFRDYIYVDDFVSAALKIGGNYQGLFNVSSGIKTSLAELVETFKLILKSDIHISYGVPRSYDRDSYVLDNSKIHQATSWKPVIDLEKGLRLTLLAE